MAAESPCVHICFGSTAESVECVVRISPRCSAAAACGFFRFTIAVSFLRDLVRQLRKLATLLSFARIVTFCSILTRGEH